MAIVFISPGERQKVFILAIAGFFVVLVVVIGLAVFFAKPKPVPREKVFVAPKISINFDLLKSANVQGLEPMPEVDRQFEYTARDAKGVAKTGKIATPSEATAIEILTGLGLNSIILKEAAVGRDNPFIPYYQLTAPKSTKK